MQASVLLSTLFAFAATVTAAPAPNSDPVAAELVERQGACPQGYYPCVTGQNQLCPIGCISTHDPIAKLACLQGCTARSHANCRAWCA